MRLGSGRRHNVGQLLKIICLLKTMTNVLKNHNLLHNHVMYPTLVAWGVLNEEGGEEGPTSYHKTRKKKKHKEEPITRKKTFVVVVAKKNSTSSSGRNSPPPFNPGRNKVLKEEDVQLRNEHERKTLSRKIRKHIDGKKRDQRTRRSPFKSERCTGTHLDKLSVWRPMTLGQLHKALKNFN